MRPDRNEVHIYLHENGHELSEDCWCEPRGTWYRNIHGVLIFVVEHDDDEKAEPVPHAIVLQSRELAPDWVTTALNQIGD